MELETGELAEQSYDGGSICYLVYDPRTGIVRKQTPPLVTCTGDRYNPILNDFVKHKQVSLPSDAIEYESDVVLCKEITEFIDRWYEESDQNQLLTDALYVMFTYIADLVPISPYLRKYGKFGGGKSTFVKVVGELCHRAFHVAGCSTEAALRRTLHVIQGTALIDEADFSHSDLHATIIKILNVGNDQRQGWYICANNNEKKPRETLSFYVYGPKVLATRERWQDLALESRCINSQSKENRGARPLFQTKEFQRGKQQLINKLQMWRFRNYHEFKKKQDSLEDPDIMKKVFGEDMKISSRIKQIIIPLTLIFDDEVTKRRLKELMIQQDQTLRAMDQESTLENDIRQAIARILRKRLDNVEKLTKLTKLLEGRRAVSFTIKEISQSILGTDYAPSNEIGTQSRKVIKYLRDRCDLTARHGTGNVPTVEFPIDKLLMWMGATGSLTTLTTLTPTDLVSILELSILRLSPASDSIFPTNHGESENVTGVAPIRRNEGE